MSSGAKKLRASALRIRKAISDCQTEIVAALRELDEGEEELTRLEQEEPTTPNRTKSQELAAVSATTTAGMVQRVGKILDEGRKPR